MVKRQLPGLDPEIAYRLGSFEDWKVRTQSDNLTANPANFNWLHELYDEEFSRHMQKSRSLNHDQECQDAVRLVVKSAVRYSQGPESYIGDVYNVDLPDSLKWYANMTGRGVFTSYAWISDDQILPVMLEKYSTSGYPPYEPWRAEELWRITGDGWELTFGGNRTTWCYRGNDSHCLVPILWYSDTDEYDSEYASYNHRIDSVVCPRLIGDEDKFLSDLCLLKLL